MRAIEVSDIKSRRDFLEFPKHLYKEDKNWTCPLDVEIEGIFNPQSNSSFKFGEAIRWVLKDDRNKTLGRIAAFYDNRKKDHSYVTAGNVGFFECINDQSAANVLFDTARTWLESKGMKAMDGNCNFGENLFHWGVLVHGFIPQGIGMPYNPPYYKELFENYGFKEYFQQLSYYKDLRQPWPERYYKFATFLASRPDYRLEHFRFDRKEKYLNDFVHTYNAIWEDFHEEYTPLQYDDIFKIFTNLQMIIDEQLIWFAYVKEKPIGICVGLPDVNIVLRKLKNGKLNLMNKLKMLYYLKLNRSIMNRCRVIMSGVIPEYQQKGVIAILFLKLSNTLVSKGFRDLELSWTGDYNKPVLNIYEQVGAYHQRTHVTYRYIFEKNIKFERFTNEKGYKARKKTVQ